MADSGWATAQEQALMEIGSIRCRAGIAAIQTGFDQRGGELAAGGQSHIRRITHLLSCSSKRAWRIAQMMCRDG
jgi:hypothetical protein